MLSRIRRRLEVKGIGLFVYAGVEKYDLNLVNYQFLQSLADSLDYTGSEKVTQWQELAAAMANQVWKSLNPNADNVPAKKVVETFNHPNNLVAQNKKWVDDLSSKFRKIKRSDPYIIRAIFWTLSEEYALSAVRWLSGKALVEVEANAMGLPNYSNEERYQNAEAFNTVSQILSLISEYKPVVICFDEIEPHKSQCNDAGLTTPHLVAGLIKALVDDVKLSRHSQGIVIVTVMLPDTWELKIKLMPGGIVDRVSAKGEPIKLHLMDGDSIIQLVTLWLKDFYQERNLKPHSPVYPFEESKLRELKKDSSVRAILKWCAENFKLGTLPPDEIELAFNKELTIVEKSIQKLIEDKAQLANAMRLVLSTTIGQTIEKFTIQAIEEVKPQKDNNGYIDFKVIGNENGKIAKIGVSIIQQNGGNGVLAGLKKLTEYKKFDLTRGCLVRSKEISRTATQAQQYLSKLQSPELGGKWVKVKSEDIKSLLAILSVSNGKDYELTETQIKDFITQKKLAVSNNLVCDILRPSSQVSNGLIDQ
ncbi:MAG: hypothetical protein PUP93_23450 [Rhizonema sp. NSF051]|nr:hypothetical protein [Rhizonema sp. NSF051]